MSDHPFADLQKSFDQGQAAQMLATLAQTFLEQKKFHELFEARKMELRNRLGLSIQTGDGSDKLDEAGRQKLEEGLLAACREVGTLLLQAGRVRDGWMYMRPVGDKELASNLLSKIEPDEDNTEELIEVFLHEGVDVGRGFELVLTAYGTCSSITTYDSGVARLPRKEQAPAARALLKRLHADLVASVKNDIARQEGAHPTATTLKELVHDREWLFQGHSYHIDTTHLASTVRIARACDKPEDFRLALDLTEYGRRLDQQFQYPGDEPFAETYPSHALFFAALLGENVDEALSYFRQKAEMLDAHYQGMAPIEGYVDLLARLGRYEEALTEAIRLTPAGAQPIGYAPSLIELAKLSGNFDAVLAYCEQKGDLLGYAAAMVEKASHAKPVA